jgi:hypothetical protein
MFKRPIDSKFTTTENGAVALKTTSNYLVDYFMMFTRTLYKDSNYEYLQKCWETDPVKTVAIIFNGRDRLKGKKEKKVSNEAMMWLRQHKPKTYMLNILNYVNKYGCWKDLLYIAYHNKIQSLDKNYELELFARQLLEDQRILLEDERKSVSLCAKWSPSENDRNDKRKQFAKKLATIIYSKDDDKKMEKYRKEILTPLRKRINIVEKLMCNNEWDKIDYQSVPGVASKRLLKAFMKHDADRYQKYLEAVRKGEKTIKVTGLLPHELLKYYIDNQHTHTPNETIELQWRTILENIRKSGILHSSIPIVDLSGSMFIASNGDIPAQVSAALGILTSLCSQEPFYKKVLTFSEHPQMLTLPSESLFECFNHIRTASYGLSTNFEKCCKSIIDYGVKNNVKNEDMPKKLFVFSDMQFDQASPTNNKIETLYDHVRKMFITHNYTAPTFVYWNLNSDSGETFPIDCKVPNTALVSGFSEQLLKIFMEYDEFNPEIIVEEVLKPYLPDIKIDEDEI